MELTGTSVRILFPTRHGGEGTLMIEKESENPVVVLNYLIFKKPENPLLVLFYEKIEKVFDSSHVLNY